MSWAVLEVAGGGEGQQAQETSGERSVEHPGEHRWALCAAQALQNSSDSKEASHRDSKDSISLVYAECLQTKAQDNNEEQRKGVLGAQRVKIHCKGSTPGGQALHVQGGDGTITQSPCTT